MRKIKKMYRTTHCYYCGMKSNYAMIDEIDDCDDYGLVRVCPKCLTGMGYPEDCHSFYIATEKGATA